MSAVADVSRINYERVRSTLVNFAADFDNDQLVSFFGSASNDELHRAAQLVMKSAHLDDEALARLVEVRKRMRATSLVDEPVFDAEVDAEVVASRERVGGAL